MSEGHQLVDVDRMRWSLARVGRGPVALLVHGMGASLHSWRDVVPRLAERFTVISVDLPGHGGTSRAAGAPTLDNTAARLADLVRSIAEPIELAVGHSAGAAILARMAIDGVVAPRRLIGFNAAFFPFQGGASSVFTAAARLMTSSRMVARLFARRARDRHNVERILASTGSRLDADGVAHYQRLATSPEHVGSVLAMMAHWRLEPLLDDLPRLRTPLDLVVGRLDRAVPPIQARRVVDRVPNGRWHSMPGGHLCHEEWPEEAADLVIAAWETE